MSIPDVRGRVGYVRGGGRESDVAGGDWVRGKCVGCQVIRDLGR